MKVLILSLIKFDSEFSFKVLIICILMLISRQAFNMILLITSIQKFHYF